MKRSHIEQSDSEEEDDPEEGNDNLTSDVTPDLTSDSSARDTSTASNIRPRCSKQSKHFNAVWLTGRKHWPKYEKGVGILGFYSSHEDQGILKNLTVVQS